MIHIKSSELAGPPDESVAEAAAVAPVVTTPRFFHLDALRAFLMFWGVLVHSSTLDPDNHVFRGFAVVSGLVRMEAFFVISGFLAYMLLKKYGAKVAVNKRLLAIGVPFVTALMLLNPVTNYLIYTFHNSSIGFADYLAGKGIVDAEGPMNWHLHLWFLVGLFVYSLIAPLVERLIDRGLAASRLSIARPELVFLVMCAGVAAACLASRIGFELIKPLLPVESHYVFKSLGNFLPFYALGMLLFAAAGMREVFSRVHLLQTLASCALLFLATEQGGEDPGRAQETLILCAQTYVAMTLSSLLFWVAGKWVRGGNETVRQLSDSAYSVYLFHFIAIYVFAHLLRGVIPGSMSLLTLVAVATFATTLCFHRFVIRRVPALVFLFNGKPLRRTK